MSKIVLPSTTYLGRSTPDHAGRQNVVNFVEQPSNESGHITSDASLDTLCNNKLNQGLTKCRSRSRKILYRSVTYSRVDSEYINVLNAFFDESALHFNRSHLNCQFAAHVCDERRVS
jgi:hypothetical protein